MDGIERDVTRTAEAYTCRGLKLDFETFETIADVLLMMSTDFILLQPTIVCARKDDGTPVSNADKEIQGIIINYLLAFAPEIPIRGEEDDSSAPSAITPGGVYWSVDPIDGTRFYEAMKDEWCVSVALVIDGKPWAAIVLQPARGEAFIGVRHKGVRMRTYAGQWKPFKRKKPPNPMLVVPTSRSVLCDPAYAEQAVRLTNCFQDTFSVPSVLAGLEITRGHAWGWISIFKPWHWDVAATYVLVRETGGVGMCANGGLIPWHQDKLPPIVFAASREHAAAISWALNNKQK